MPLNLIGSDWDVINVSIPLSATDTEITYARAVKSFVYWSRSQNQFTVKRRVADSKFITLFAGERLDSRTLLSDANIAGSSLGFVTINGGSTDVIEGIVTF